jgi:hypothetical protein
MTDTLSTNEAAFRAKVSVRQLQIWAESGYVHPVRGASNGASAAPWRWSYGDVDRAELLGLVSRQVRRPDLLERLAAAIECGTCLVLPDGDHEVVLSWRRRQYEPAVGGRLD